MSGWWTLLLALALVLALSGALQVSEAKDVHGRGVDSGAPGRGVAELMKPHLRKIRRTSKMEEMWHHKRGRGSLKNARTAGGNSLTKPAQLACTEEGFFPQPGACHKFYRCVDLSGTKTRYAVFRFDCPFGTVFDDDLDICNHPWAVSNPPECAGAMANLPLPEPPGVDTAGGTPGTPGNMLPHI
ncbi:hypothetical protein Pcinc_031609 [Petrolisthes cinctipes]|uniref:Chitin-binding type-2 domain-containing protein n=1 Tax=Petrolisthes cinctipes TaxID=88211 RepID=A0AAE1EW97_PETCI|nr:hypothetical protein Pcinc_031609 [Petrolisthes cinctipes]